MNQLNQRKHLEALLKDKPEFKNQNWMYQKDTSKPALLPTGFISDRFNTLENVDDVLDGFPFLSVCRYEAQQVVECWNEGEWETLEDFSDSLGEVLNSYEDCREAARGSILTDDTDEEEEDE